MKEILGFILIAPFIGFILYFVFVKIIWQSIKESDWFTIFLFLSWMSFVIGIYLIGI